MSQMPILTSGARLLADGLIEDPRDKGDEGDWAEVVVVEASKDEARLAGEYWQTGYHAFLASGDVGRLDAFEGETIAGYRLMTDPDLVEDFADVNRGFDPGELYQP